MRGFLVFDHAERFPHAISDLAAWAAEGTIKAEIDVVDGLERAPDALSRLFTGGNRGKQLVKVA